MDMTRFPVTARIDRSPTTGLSMIVGVCGWSSATFARRGEGL